MLSPLPLADQFSSQALNSWILVLHSAVYCSTLITGNYKKGVASVSVALLEDKSKLGQNLKEPFPNEKETVVAD